MKARTRRDSRLLAMFGILAVLPLAIWACTDAGDAPAPPTGPGTRYDPRMDQRGATITATATNSTWAPGTIQGITAVFRDGNGLPVEGAPLAISTEGNFSHPPFTFNTNPTLTDGNGMASIKVTVPADCPTDSYTFVISTFPAGPVDGPMARGYVHIVVSGAGSAAITSIVLSTTTPSVTLPDDVNLQAVATATAGCTPALSYKATGAGINVPNWTGVPGSNPWLFSLDPSAPGTLTVFVAAFCTETGEGLVSDAVNVTVSAP